MNKNLEKAMFDLGKADALMFTIESLYLDLEFLPEEKELVDRGVYVFYALWDAIRSVKDHLDKLDGDFSVIDAIYAVNGISSDCTLTKEQ